MWTWNVVSCMKFINYRKHTRNVWLVLLVLSILTFTPFILWRYSITLMFNHVFSRVFQEVYPFLPVQGASQFLLKPCRLNQLDPWDSSLRPFFNVTLPPLDCDKQYPLVFIDQNGYVQFNESVLTYYSMTSFKCTYSVIKREDGDTDVTFLPEVEFDSPVFVQSRFFRVKCKESAFGSVVYDFPHMNLRWTDSVEREKMIRREDDDNYSILFLGIDALSRSHAIRMLPKSYRYLTEILRAYDFQGYMKVGQNTFPNLIPLLTGRESGMFPQATILHEFVHLDFLPLIWKETWMSHYATLYSEDRPDISAFNFMKGGFRKSPVDYFYRPYTLATEKITPVVINEYKIIHGNPCYGNTYNLSLQMEFLKGFLERYRDRLRFAFTWSNGVGHENFRTVSWADAPLLEFLKWLTSGGHLERAILFVLSDHGFMLGGLTETYVGRLESSMPFLAVYVPEKLKQKRPWIHETLSRNSKRLTTPFDIYQTVKDIAKRNINNIAPALTKNAMKIKRSIFSLIPDERSCADAGIPETFCTCQNSAVVNTTHPLVRVLARAAVSKINKYLNGNFHVCRKISLKAVTDAHVTYMKGTDTKHEFYAKLFGETVLRKRQIGRYKITFRTIPGNALYDAVVDFERLDLKPEGQITVVGEPQRIDRYGQQSHCIHDSFLKNFCYCNDLDPSTAKTTFM